MLFVWVDWAEDHHGVEIQDESERRLARARLPDGVARMWTPMGLFSKEPTTRHLGRNDPDQHRA